MFALVKRSWCVCVPMLVLACGGWTQKASGIVLTYACPVCGPAESPPNASPGTGFVTVIYDNVAHTMRVEASFSGLLGPTTAAHIQATTTVAGTGTAIVATTTPSFAGFPLGVTSGTYDNTLDLTQASSYNPAFVTANGGTMASAELALTSAIAAGKAYFNIHSTVFPGGEIRGFPILIQTLGTCCDASAACVLETQAQCVSGTWTVGGICTPNPCPGVCCDVAGACSLISQTACGGGMWSVTGTCTPNLCIGTCCGAAGVCSMLSQSGCGSGNWSTGGACTPSPCPGACCAGAMCTVRATAAACGTGFFLGARTACSVVGRYGPVNLCCPADFNNNGMSNVADIFAFLSAWFGGCP